MLRHTRQAPAADFAEADVPVAVNAAEVVNFRVIEMHHADVFQPDAMLNDLESRRAAILFAPVVTGGERVRGVETDAEV